MRFPTPALPGSGTKGRGVAALSRNSPSDIFNKLDDRPLAVNGIYPHNRALSRDFAANRYRKALFYAIVDQFLSLFIVKNHKQPRRILPP
jgi:hypothetical protein